MSFAFISKKDSLSKPAYQELLGDKLVYAKQSKGPHFQFSYSKVDDYQENLDKYFTEHQDVTPVPVDPISDPEFFGPLLQFLFPLLMFGLLFVLMMRKMGGGASGGAGGGIFNIGKSKAQLFDKGTKVNITFTDVAGLDEAKQEVMEIVDFLKNPKNILPWVVKFRKVLFWWGLPERERLCWQKPWRVRLKCHSFLCRVQILLRCL